MVNRRDVAKKAGVSPATVSRVLGNYGSVSPEIASRVTKIATDLGYRPNLAARSLKTNRTGRIGVVVHEIVNPYYAEIVAGIEEQAKEEGYVVSVCAASDVGDLPSVDGFLDQQFDGVIFAASWYAFTHTRLPALVSGGMPVVFGAEVITPADSAFHRVLFDWQATAETAVSYLLDMGHERIAYLSNMDLGDDNVRYLGYLAAMQKRGLPVDDKLLFYATNLSGIACGQAGMETFLARNAKPTAIFAFNDLVAAGAMATALDAGLHVPDDVSIMGMDDLPIASILRPSLSTIRVPKVEQGRLLVWIIARLLENEEIQLVWPLDGGLIVRQTTQRYPGH